MKYKKEQISTFIKNVFINKISKKIVTNYRKDNNMHKLFYLKRIVHLLLYTIISVNRRLADKRLQIYCYLEFSDGETALESWQKFCWRNVFGPMRLEICI